MTEGFPRYSPEARKGQAGVSLVAKVVTDDLGWIFRSTHQEHDFGIDGQIEIVTDQGAVTGQGFGVQIKHGHSFFKETSQWGYVYRGAIKHFNYLANYPAIALIIICDPKSKVCYWVAFDPEAAEVHEQSWKICIPFENRLNTSKAALRALIGAPVDQLNELRPFWELNKNLFEASTVLYGFDEIDVSDKDTSRPRAFFDRLLKTKALAASTMGKIELSFFGYDDDPRELFEIPEVRDYVKALDAIFPELFFFAVPEEPASTLRLFGLCVCNGTWEGPRSTPGTMGKVSCDGWLLANFMERHFEGFNDLADWIGITEEKIREISYAVIRRLGCEVPPKRL